MFTSEKQLYIQETEIKPNRYATYVLSVTLFVIIVCWVINELGIFRVGDLEMRIGSIITILAIATPLGILLFNKDMLANPKMKYVIILASSVFTFSVGVLLTFHTTIMLLFPIMFAMLYRSRSIGIIAVTASMLCTLLTPIVGYLLQTWDIPLFEELILIGTDGGAVTVAGGGEGHSWLNIGKIILYLVLPRLMMVGSCSVLLFNNIKIGVANVNHQITLNRMSHIDNLTGLYNQNYLKDYISFIENSPVITQIGAIFLDVNGLKNLNDTMGHEYGDTLIKRCAESILAVCDDNTVIGFRAGGDEFVIVFAGATDAVLMQKVTEWEDALIKINRKYNDNINCSMATGYCTGFNKDIKKVISDADAFMYRNKTRMKAER